eukprot:2574765-Amphidinium_carterae.1
MHIRTNQHGPSTLHFHTHTGKLGHGKAKVTLFLCIVLEARIFYCPGSAARRVVDSSLTFCKLNLHMSIPMANVRQANLQAPWRMAVRPPML